jgi:hypothetical protein
MDGHFHSTFEQLCQNNDVICFQLTAKRIQLQFYKGFIVIFIYCDFYLFWVWLSFLAPVSIVSVINCLSNKTNKQKNEVEQNEKHCEIFFFDGILLLTYFIYQPYKMVLKWWCWWWTYKLQSLRLFFCLNFWHPCNLRLVNRKMGVQIQRC